MSAFLSTIQGFFTQNWAECLKTLGMVFSACLALYSLRHSKTLERKVAEQSRVDRFKEEREKRWGSLIGKFESTSRAVEVARDFVAIGEGTSFDEIIRRAVEVMSSIQAMPKKDDSLMNRWVRSVHLEEVEILRPALVAIVLDSSRSPTRRAEATYKRRMDLYRRTLDLTRARLDYIASVYGLRRDAPKMDAVLAIALARDGAPLDEIEKAVRAAEGHTLGSQEKLLISSPISDHSTAGDILVPALNAAPP